MTARLRGSCLCTMAAVRLGGHRTDWQTCIPTILQTMFKHRPGPSRSRQNDDDRAWRDAIFHEKTRPRHPTTPARFATMVRNVLKSTILALAVLSPPTTTQAEAASPIDISEMIAMFSDVCLHDFPDSAKVNAYLLQKSARAMTRDEVNRYLKSDPGRGWYIKTPIALYAVTQEDPPYHTCAIRRMTPVGAMPSDFTTFANMVKDYAANQGGSTVPIPVSHQRPNPIGPDVMSFGIGLLVAGQPSETFGVFLSNYHSRIPEPWVADGTPGVGIEVRFSRQVFNR